MIKGNAHFLVSHNKQHSDLSQWLDGEIDGFTAEQNMLFSMILWKLLRLQSLTECFACRDRSRLSARHYFQRKLAKITTAINVHASMARFRRLGLAHKFASEVRTHREAKKKETEMNRHSFEYLTVDAARRNSMLPPTLSIRARLILCHNERKNGKTTTT